MGQKPFPSLDRHLADRMETTLDGMGIDPVKGLTQKGWK